MNNRWTNKKYQNTDRLNVDFGRQSTELKLSWRKWKGFLTWYDWKQALSMKQKQGIIGVIRQNYYCKSKRILIKELHADSLSHTHTHKHTHTHIYIYIERERRPLNLVESQCNCSSWWYWYFYLEKLIGLVGRVCANGPGDQGSIPGRVIPKT